MHGSGHVGRWVDAFDFDPHHAHAPFVGGVVEHGAQLGVDHLARRQRLVELGLPDDIAQIGLGKFGGGVVKISHVVGQLDRVGRLVVDNGVDCDHHIVLGDHLLGLDIDHLLAHIDFAHCVDERDDKLQPWLSSAQIAAQSFDDPFLVGRDDTDAQCGQQKDQKQEQAQHQKNQSQLHRTSLNRVHKTAGAPRLSPRQMSANPAGRGARPAGCPRSGAP